jgi:hypothetical protein
MLESDAVLVVVLAEVLAVVSALITESLIQIAQQ